jgi:hypothetical protein
MKPILCSTPMAQALLAGNKTQTRRVIKPRYENTHFEMRTDKYGTRLIEVETFVEGVHHRINLDGTTMRKMRFYKEIKSRYAIGDMLFVKETWQQTYDCRYHYKADEPENTGWKSSIHMPREAARLFLRVTDLREERLQDITVEDCMAEGLDCDNSINNPDPATHDGIRSWNTSYSQMLYKELWDKLYAKRGYPWECNPWVWVYTFERITV